MNELYVVHYWLDDGRGKHGTPGHCRTDHRLAIGETFYAGPGRASVRSCHQVTEAPPRVYLQGGNYRIL